MNTKDKGEISELTVILEFKKHNVPVLIPYGDNQKYDIVIEINDRFFRVQVKTGYLHNGCVVLNGRSSTYEAGKGRGRRIQNYMGKVDFFALHHNSEVWLIPIHEVGKSGTMMLRTDYPKHGCNRLHIKWAKDYEFEKQLNKLLES